MDETGLAGAFRDQRAAALFLDHDEMLFQRIVVDIAEMHIIELHSTDLLQLLLHPSANLQCVFETGPYILPVELTMGMQQLDQSRYCLAYRDHVTLIEVVSQFEVLVDRVRMAAFAHLAEVLRQVINNQPV